MLEGDNRFCQGAVCPVKKPDFGVGPVKNRKRRLTGFLFEYILLS
jgi:hypothetical protein